MEINNKTIWGGYGYLGMYSLLAIDQVESVKQ
jgi:hypothetical protein